MGKKGKGTKKEEKPKKEPLSSRDRLKEARETQTSLLFSRKRAPRDWGDFFAFSLSALFSIR